MTPTVKHRSSRFVFRLRTLFIVVTIICVWLGWQLQIVRERKTVLTEIRRHTQDMVDMSVEALEADGGIGIDDKEIYRVSRLRRLLGDESYVLINIPPSVDIVWIERAEIAFPEAALHVRLFPDFHDLNSLDSYERSPFRDSLYKPVGERRPNRGSIFKTGVIAK